MIQKLKGKIVLALWSILSLCLTGAAILLTGLLAKLIVKLLVLGWNLI